MGILTFDGPDGSILDLVPSDRGAQRIISQPAGSALNVSPLRGTYYVDPLFAGVQTGSESNPFTTIAAAFAAAAAQGLTRGIVFLAPGATCVENVVFPAVGDWEIASLLSYGVFSATINGTVDSSCSASSRRTLNAVNVLGNITGNCSAGSHRFSVLNGGNCQGTITLTASGAGVNRLGTGSPVNEFSGNAYMQNFLTGNVSVAGSFTGSSCVFGPGSLTVTQTSSFVDCLLPPTTILNGTGALFYMQGCANAQGGPLTFSVLGGGFLQLQCDGTTLEEFARVSTILSGDVRLVNSFLGGRSSTTTQVTNVGVTGILGRLPAGLQEAQACLTLLTNTGGVTAGNAVLNAVYTDATGTLVTEPVTTALNVGGAVGSKARGSLQFSQDGSATVSWSVTGITNATNLSYKCDVAFKQAS
jgi:hypothetical protein